MAQLAIRGHETRGEEVIEILKMLGGGNKHNYSADCDSLCFYICKGDNTIYYDWINSCYEDEETLVFTVEEFLEKFPYKVGDKVLYKIYNVYSSIRKMTWNEEKEQVIYRLDSKNLWVATADELTKDNFILDSEDSEEKIKHRRFMVDVTIPYCDEYKDAEELQETIQEIFDCLCDDEGRWKVKVEYINEN